MDEKLSFIDYHSILLNHVIFPRVLPQQKPRYAHERDLITLMVENVVKLKKWMPPKTVDLMETLKMVHVDGKPRPSIISNAIDSLCPGESFAMFVRRQNSALIVYMPFDQTTNIKEMQNVIVATFPGSLHPGEIYKYDSDIEMNFPVQAIKVKFSEMLRSEDFAKQLCFLHEELPNLKSETKTRNYVSKWLLALLADETSMTASPKEFPIITKKLRDESIGDNKKSYFRRSSFYTSVKVLLQHSLTLHLGPESGKFLYKIVMLRFLVDMCGPYTNEKCDTFDMDLLSQTMAKLARRIEKLPVERPKVVSHDILHLYDVAIAKAKEAIDIIRSKIDKNIQSIHLENEDNAHLPPLSGLDFQADISHKMPKLCDYLNDRLDGMKIPSSPFHHKPKSFSRHYSQHQDSPNIQNISEIEDKLEIRVHWTEFENLVLYQMKKDDDRWTADELRDWFMQYLQYGEEKYKDNPLLTSRMMLVCMKLIAVLDRHATKAHLLLKKHHCGVNPRIINSLLLPQFKDMEIALRLEKYFRCRNENAPDPSLIGEKTISEKSFSVKLAKQDDEMLEMRRNILLKDEIIVARKRVAWTAGREKVKMLRDSANQLECEFFMDRFGRERHDNRGCNKCSLKKRANQVRLEEYEHLLPADENGQFAVVFELRIPNIIACLRDVLYLFTKLCTGASSNLKIKGNWVECSEILEYNESSSRCVTLGSTTQHKIIDYHVDFPFDILVIENSFNCIFHAYEKAIPVSIADNAIDNVCTFQTKDEYSGLQWTLNTTLHTQNEVLSRQSECPHSLSLAEYKNFGSLRADGHRLQLRKLYAMIETEALSFEKESVLSLIMQTLWECGVSGDGKAIRESHVDFGDPIFCSAMIKLLVKFIKQQEDNWAHPMKLIMAAMIAVRAFEINQTDSVANEIVALLNNIRVCALNWIKKIRAVILEVHNTDERELRLKIIYIAIAGGLTFFVHPKHKYFDAIFANDINSGETAARSWLNFAITLNNSMSLYQCNEDQLSSNLRIFMRLVETVGVYLEPKITAMVEENPNDVFELIRRQYICANHGTFTMIGFDLKYPQVLTVESMINRVSRIITIDIITGSFEVNGQPVSRLPSEVMQDENYKWFFGNASFEVQPDARNNFSTVQDLNGYNYEFTKSNDDIIITERSDRGSKKELIPFEKIRSEFPYLLWANYSHWWNKLDNCIEFRQRTSGGTHFSKQTRIDYQLNLYSYHLVHVKTGRRMLYMRSQSYQEIIKQLERLEHPKYIHVLMEKKVAVVELLRMKLKFRINSANAEWQFDMESNEFSGMRVSRTQNIGTLYGLHHGLVLESISDASTKILLIPNGHVKIFPEDLHVSVNIETKDELRNPPFYQYQVDEFCKQLKSSNGSYASWFYLAYLHAITSHGEVEPFIGMSGTERALQILQSAFAWSSSPYEPEAVEMLNAIAKLSPIRKINDHNPMVTWPTHIPARSAQDSFVFIAKKLLDDSQRLHGLYFKSDLQSINLKTDLKLNSRDYHRCLQLNPNLRVSGTFIEPLELKTSLPDPFSCALPQNTQTVAILYHKRQYSVPAELDLKERLTAGEHKFLKGISSKESVLNILFHNVYDQLPDLWISLYEAARKQEFTVNQFALILTLFAHQNEELDLILALQAIVMNPSVFELVDPPAVEAYHIFAGTFNSAKVSTLLKNFHTQPSDYDSDESSETVLRNDHEALVDKIVDELTEEVSQNWPCDTINLKEKFQTLGVVDIDFDIASANAAMNQQLLIWHNNYQLDNFLQEVEMRLNALPPRTGFAFTVPRYFAAATLEPLNWTKTEIDFDEKIRDNLENYRADILEAKDVWEMEIVDSSCSADWWSIIERTSQSDETKHLIQAGIFPRTVPSLLLPKIVDQDTDDQDTDDGLKPLIGAWAMAVAREQRQKRIETLSQREEHQALMDIENENEPHLNWRPCDYPEWLIFQIEQNLTIRRIQVEIAKRMINPPEIADQPKAKHSVMQLNMGEGKTAVIVPILAAVLADGSQACQITVLKSLFTRNLKALKQYLGGMLNKRIYTFPCRRDMPVAEYIKQIFEIYQECKGNKGVVLTLPEYRLSFQLKIYEPMQRDDVETAKRFLDVHKWINANVRNILDESDAILQANYQLIYTVGNQLPPDSGSQRWTVINAVLKRIPHQMKILYERYGKQVIEFDSNYVKNGHVYGTPMVNYRPDVFTPCRILDETVFDILREALIRDFVDGQLGIGFPEIVGTTKDDLKFILTQKVIDKKTFETIESYPLNERNTILILSGLLRFEVLKLALTKRWRVNYGVNPKGNRKMAIPFKAKDVAAEMTEFGHPDVAICLTQLSYYYSGLTDDQLYHLFAILENKQNASAIYEKWIQSVPVKLRDTSIESYTGVNLDDPSQRDNLLFPLLRFNMHAIDFWLSNVVFPYEAKIFQKKLMCTAWDLCSEHLEHRVTGFSGTNDTKNILPLPIAQNDLEELESTNENVRQILVQEENQFYEGLPANISGKQILEKLARKKIPVLLDSGALMLELTNEQVAEKWLKLVSERRFEAAVYFDSNGVLQTIDRNGVATEFDYSVYRDNLSRCLVYLDDMHTRGTDLKFPMNCKACVTLSGDITRDKTVQSCMRMRELGKGRNGHSIAFWASYEADLRIRKMCELSLDEEIVNEHVVKFITENSKQFEKANMVHWAASSVNYTKKLIGHMLFEDTSDDDAIEELYNICVDNEFVKLSDMYGDKEEAFLIEIAQSKFEKLAADFENDEEVKSLVQQIKNSVDEKLNKYAGDVKQFSHALDEEQEKELEQELEEQRDVERPSAVKAAKPEFNKQLEELILNGIVGKVIDKLKTQRTLLPITSSLLQTQLFRFYKKNKDAWATYLLITKDFQTVIEGASRACDDYLRPVWWIARVNNLKGKDILILLSSYECDRLLPAFRKSIKSTLFMYRPRLSILHDNLLGNTELQLTKMEKTENICIEDAIQIGMFSGSMYFDSEAEQNAYCGFLGLIPRPRTEEQENAFENGYIKPKGFVPAENRRKSEAISSCVVRCKFQDNPVDLAIKLVEAHHQTLLKESHVASILDRGTKMAIKAKNSDE